MKQFFLSMAGYLRPYWLSVSFIFFAIAVQASFKLGLPFAFQLTFDRAIPHQDLPYLRQLLAVMFIWWLIQAVLALIQDIVAAKTGISAINDLRADMFERLHLLPIDYFDRGSSGDLMARFSIDLVALEKAGIRSIYIFFFSCFNVLASLALLFYIEWRLALVTLLGLILSTLAPRHFSGKAKRQSYQRQEEEAKVSGFVKETLDTADIIHAFNLWETTRHSFLERLAIFKKKAVRAYKLSAFASRFGGQSAALLQLLVLIMGGFLVIGEFLTAGTLVGFLALLANMVGGTSHLSAVIPDIIGAAGAMQRVEEFMNDIKTTDEDEDQPALPRLKEAIAFENVSFGYSDDDQVLKRLSFRLRRGMSVAIVGPSGSGKSTLLKLLLRFYDPSQGHIDWDGADVRKYSKTSLRDQISIVPQDSVLFDTSLLENIRMGRLDASDEEVIEAAEQAELHNVISHLPEGYDTQVGERGSHLSGGQRQRVAIARALLRDPALLILDEATSALDPLTEKALNETLMRIAKERTLISVTHRLAIAKSVDQVLVIHDGQIAQQGHHDDLIDAEGIYAKLWRKQTGFTISRNGFRAECSPHRLALIPLFEKLSLERLERISDVLVSEFFPGNGLSSKRATRATSSISSSMARLKLTTLNEMRDTTRRRCWIAAISSANWPC